MVYDAVAGKMVPNKSHPLSHSVQGKTYRKKGSKEDIVFTWGGTKDSSETNDEAELINKYMRDKELEYFNQSKFQDQAEKLFNEFFETNLKFKTHFTWEAATGSQKFKGDLDPQAYWMFKFSIPGKNIVTIEPLGDSGPSPYTKKMAKKMSYRMSWKTHSSKDAGTHPALRGETTPGKVAKLRDLLGLAPHDFGALNNQFVSPMSKMINEEFNAFMEAESENMGKLLNEWNAWYDQEVLNEGLLSWAKGAKDKIAGKLKQTIGRVYNKILNFLKALVKKVFDTMRALADKGVSAVLEYIGIEPKTVQVSLPF